MEATKVTVNLQLTEVLFRTPKTIYEDTIGPYVDLGAYFHILLINIIYKSKLYRYKIAWICESPITMGII